MDFLWFDLLVLLVLIPVLVTIYIWSLRRRRPSGVRYSSLTLVRDAEPGSSRLRRHLPFVVFVAALGALIVAMARPVAIVAVPTNQTTIILTIDVSGSMCSADIPPSRIEAAEAAASSFINAQAASVRIGIVAFSSYAEVVQVPTNDRAALLAALHSLTTGRRTAIGDGILASIDAIAEVDPAVAKSQTDSSTGGAPVPVPKGDYAPDIVVLLTDGASNTGTPPLDAAQQAADRGVRVYTIGFGTANGGSMNPSCAPQFQGREPGAGGFSGGRGGGGGSGTGTGGGTGAGGGGNFRRGIDEATLQKIADMTGGKYYPAESASQLQGVFQSLPTNLIFKHEATEISFAFVGLGGLLSALAFLLGKAWRPLPWRPPAARGWATKKSAMTREASNESGEPPAEASAPPTFGQVCQPPLTIRVATEVPLAQSQIVVVEGPSVETIDESPHRSSERHLAITSSSGEKTMSTLPPPIGITPSDVPWMANTETGRARTHGTSALPSAVAMLPETGAIAAIRSDSSQPRR